MWVLLWTPLVVSLVVLLAIFFWIWWALPRDQVPPHLSEIELKRLETQDRIRQTSYQLLTGLALVATFALTIIQAGINARQWSADFELKTGHERLGHFTEALKNITTADKDNTTARLGGVTLLRVLATQDATNYFQVPELLAALVRSRTTDDFLKLSIECNGVQHEKVQSDIWATREEAQPDVQAAMTTIGDRTLAKYKRQFNRNASALQQCERKTGFNVGQLLVLDHLYLDDLALYGTDFSCVSMTQSKLRRTGFAYATLRGTNFSGANLDDFTIPGMVEFMHGEMVKRQPPVTETTWLNDAEPDWRRYRCWSADFRYADLEGALFDNAGVAGADFRGANLEGVSFHGANVSRANFKGARNLVKKAFDGACAGKGDSLGAQPLHDIPDFKVLGC